MPELEYPTYQEFGGMGLPKLTPPKKYIPRVGKAKGGGLAMLKFLRQTEKEEGEQELKERKFFFEQQKFAQEQELSKRKAILGTYIGRLKEEDPGTVAYEQAQKIVRRLSESAPDWMKASLSPWLAQVIPVGKMKEAEFERARGKPIDPSSIDPSVDPVSRAKLEFANADYQADKIEYITGIAQEKSDVEFIGENQWAWRDDKGKMGVLSREGTTGQEWIQKTLDKAKMTWDMAMIQGGEVSSGASKTITDGRTRYELTPTTNILNGRKGFKKVPVGRVIREGQRKLPQVISDFSTSWTLSEAIDETDGGAFYKHIQNKFDALEWIPLDEGEIRPSKLDPEGQALLLEGMIREELGTHMAGWNVRVYSPGKFTRGWTGAIDHFAESSNAVIYFIPGVLIPFENEGGEFVGALYWDEEYDIVRDGMNQVKGTRREAEADAFGLPKDAWVKGEKE